MPMLLSKKLPIWPAEPHLADVASSTSAQAELRQVNERAGVLPPVRFFAMR